MKRLSYAICSFGTFALFGGLLAAETSKPAGKVTLRTNEVAVSEITAGAKECPKNLGTTARLKVNANNEIDVMVRYKVGSSVVSKPFRGQEPGSEISTYQCVSNANFEVFSRPVGTVTDWNKVK